MVSRQYRDVRVSLEPYAALLSVSSPPVQPSPLLLLGTRFSSPVLTSSARSWQTATSEDDLSLYFPGRSSSSNKGISFFFLFSLPPLSFPFSNPSLPSAVTVFIHLAWPLLPSLSLSLPFFSLSLTVFLLNDRPFTAVSDDVAGARRFPRESRVSLTLLSPLPFSSLSHPLFLFLSLSFLSISSFLSAIGFPFYRYRLR